jgi:integrase
MLIGYPTREEWINTYNEESTKKSIRSALNQFDDFLEANKIDEKQFFEEIKKMDENELFLILDRIKNNLEQKYEFRTTGKSYFRWVLKWLRLNGIRFDDKVLQMRIRWNKIPKEMKYTPDRAVIQRMIDLSPFHYQVFFYMATATGARQAELLSLKVEDIDFSARIPTVHFKAENTKTKQERYSFLTPEATFQLKKLIEGKGPKDEIFSLAKISLLTHMARLRPRLGMKEKYQTGTAKLTIHRIRAFSKRQLSRACGDDFAHMILGHSEGLATYDADNLEGLMDDYEKAIPGLTIGLHEQDKAIKRKQGEQIKMLQEEMERLKQKIEHESNDLEDK